jgi:uncharacterized membrane protein YkvA (DUF1232 family)
MSTRQTTHQQTITIELNPREQRIYDRLRSQVVTEKPRGASSGLADLLLLLPDFTVLLVRLLRDERVPIVAKGLAVLGVAYVVSPIDIMPSLLFGPIGLVDDLIIVAAAVSAMMNHVHPDVVRAHWSGQGDVLDALQRVTNWTEERVAGGVRGVLDRLMVWR